MRARSPTRYPHAGHAGQDVLTAARGGIGRRDTVVDTEETPLLPGANGGNGKKTPDEEELELDSLPWYRRPSIYWMLPVFFVSTLAFGGIIVPKLNLILSLICREFFADESAKDPTFKYLPVVLMGDNPQCRNPEVQSEVAQFTLYGNLLAGLLSAITSPKLGALSDRYGRLPIMVLTSFGMLASEVLVICAAKYPETFSVNWILLGYALDGLFGSFIAALAIAHSYATDCTPAAKRSVVFAYFHAALFTGIALGPIIAAYIIKAMGSVISVFYIAIGVHAAFLLFTGLIMPESLSKTRQRAAREKHALDRLAAGPSSDWINRIRHFNVLEPLKILYPKGPGSSPALRRNLLLLAAVDTTIFGVAMGSMTVVIIYTNYAFAWGNFETARFVSIVNISRVFCLVVLLPIATRLVRGRRSSSSPSSPSSSTEANTSKTKYQHTGCDNLDLAVIRVAIFFDFLGYLGYALSRSGTAFLASGTIAALGGIGSPTLQSALTKHVPADRTGQMLGAAGLLHALARVVAPTVFNAVYSLTVGKFSQAVFVCLAVLFGGAFVCAWGIKAGLRLEEEDAVDVVGAEEDAEDADVAVVG
ncbi:uncharacterized protein K452DRAFT_234467 [Aplosporella prunicola CBS 121167]|uniref:Major facilitator superfamily (MFS) profile domain-containing protein n=1 Tax=Aplosporella prunicola CBS 121167 TaxID=1176127 RepID=A0A6A6B2B7_9PEZI|nr:uncharacterized protein K452DRAFT_234467 [Aplosporella prunicola CBS 121167]KAF2138200.1 hypothetical protein K452DRAFT_234467 [Aplosporella prunicola CBS 121167]